ncbi:MAG: hypothetical protein ACRBCJ_11155 [Hyphomicrobiaceae bacterium]
MTDQATKSIGIKFIGSNRAAETLSIEPGTTVADVLQTLGLGAGFHLSDPNKPEAIFQASDNLYARISNNGDMLACSALVDAGLEIA